MSNKAAHLGWRDALAAWLLVAVGIASLVAWLAIERTHGLLEAVAARLFCFYPPLHASRDRPLLGARLRQRTVLKFAGAATHAPVGAGRTYGVP